MTINDEIKHSQDKVQISRKIILYWTFVGIILIASAILTFLFLDAQYKLNFEHGKFDAALDTIGGKNEEIQSYKTEIEIKNSQITGLNSKVNSQSSEIDSQNLEIISLRSEIDSLRSEIKSLNSKISSLSTVKITRVDVVNNSNFNQYIFIDGRLTAGTRGGGGKTYFYIPPGTYSLQACSDPYKSDCGSKKSFTASKSTFSWTIK
jgi:hypothetical protein